MPITIKATGALSKSWPSHVPICTTAVLSRLLRCGTCCHCRRWFTTFKPTAALSLSPWPSIQYLYKPAVAHTSAKTSIIMHALLLRTLRFAFPAKYESCSAPFPNCSLWKRMVLPSDEFLKGESVLRCPYSAFGLEILDAFTFFSPYIWSLEPENANKRCFVFLPDAFSWQVAQSSEAVRWFWLAVTTVKHNIDTTRTTDNARERLPFIGVVLLSFERGKTGFVV